MHHFVSEKAFQSVKEPDDVDSQILEQMVGLLAKVEKITSTYNELPLEENDHTIVFEYNRGLLSPLDLNRQWLSIERVFVAHSFKIGMRFKFL